MVKNTELFAGYIPVLHAGYIEAFSRHPDADIGILDDDVLADIPYLRKDIRSLSPLNAERAIKGLGRRVTIVGRSALEAALESRPIIMPDDDVTRTILRKYPEADVQIEPVFLRWDRDNSTKLSEIKPDRVIHLDDDDPIIHTISQEAAKSSNWWRHVGALITDGKDVLVTSHNSSLPTEYTSLLESDPRITARKGESIERSIDIHAEARIIAEASRSGLSLNEKSIIVSTFPCPNCAKLIALSGIRSCYYIDGYSILDGFSILKDFGVEIIKINANLEPENKDSFVKYPTTQS